VSQRYSVRADEIGFEQVDDELLVIDFVTSDYFSLNTSASTIWSIIESEPHSVDEIAQVLAVAFEHPLDDVRRDAAELIDGLAAHGLLVRADPERNGSASAADLPAIEIAAHQPYIVPRFEKFGTLEQLMLAGE
jgi:hypothetical protein